jgi:VWFA-related protein
MSYSSVVLPLLFVGVAALLPAQKHEREAVPEVILSTDVSRVEVPVRVTDKSGKPVRDLVKEDFLLYDEGQQQTILSADYRGKPQPSTAPAGKQLTIICLDAVHVSAASAARAHDALKKLLHGSSDVLPNPVVLISLNPNLQILQPATNQSKLLLSALDAPAASAAMANPSRIDFVAAVEDVKARFERYCNDCPCARASRSLGNNCETEQRTLRQFLDAQADRASQSSTTLLDSFEAVIREAAKLPGDKTVALISDGFSLRPGSDFYSIALS